MVGVTPEIMQQGMRADYTMVDRLSEKLLQRMHSARSLTVRTEAGTTMDAISTRHSTGSRPAASSAPAIGRIFPLEKFSPSLLKVDGTFVCDATAGDHFNGKYGDLQKTPLTLKIKAGRLR